MLPKVGITQIAEWNTNNKMSDNCGHLRYRQLQVGGVQLKLIVEFNVEPPDKPLNQLATAGN